MSLSVYSPSSNKIIHETEVDFITRSIETPVHIMQYDKSLPIIAVSLRKNNAKYSLSNSYTVNVRFEKPDHTIVYNPVLGSNSTYDVIYFEVSEQMATRYGDAYATIEIILNGNIANTEAFIIIIDRNPVQEGSIESTDEVIVIEQSVNTAVTAAESSGYNGSGVGTDSVGSGIGAPLYEVSTVSAS